MRLASFVGVGSLPASDRIKLAAPRLHARFSGLGSAEKRTLPRCYGMAVLRAAFRDGMTGEPIWSLQSMARGALKSFVSSAGAGLAGFGKLERKLEICAAIFANLCFG
jgi:hypothetical protein